MHKAKLLKRSLSIMPLMIAALVLPETATADYAASCAGCHTPLATSTKKGKSAATIQAAINANTGGMGSLSTLTPAQVAAIAAELAPPPATPPVATPPPVVAPPVTTPPPVVTPPVTTPPPVVTPPVTTPTPPVTTPKPTTTPGPTTTPKPTDTPKPTVTPKPMACNGDNGKGDDNDDSMGKREGHDSDDSRRESKRHQSKIKISNPGKLYVHAEQSLRIGVAAYGDDHKITMGANLPKDANFADTYNGDLRVEQAVMDWKAPSSAAGKTMKVKFCAKAGGDSNKNSDSREVSVTVLPKLTSALTPDPVVDANVISSAVYDVKLEKLEVSGQVSWSPTSSKAEREAATTDPVKLSDAHDAIALGTAKVGLDGKWSVSIPQPRTSMPHVIDATFHDGVATQLVKQLGVMPQREKLMD